jgi:hypothetical protein
MKQGIIFKKNQPNNLHYIITFTNSFTFYTVHIHPIAQLKKYLL